MSTEAESDTGGRLQPSGELRLVRDFVNTPDGKDAQDSSQRPRGLGTWLAARGLVDQTTELSAADVARARELREALRALLLANTGEPVDPAALDTLNRIGRSAPLRVRFDESGAARLEPAASGNDAVLGRLLAIVVAAMTNESWVRLKVCRSGTCRWAFYDASKNRSGTWCSMAVCGNRNKVRTYQRRRAAGRPGVGNRESGVGEEAFTAPDSRLPIRSPDS